jgi:flagellar FliL protein
MAKLKPVPTAPVEAPVVKKKSKKLLFIIIAVLVLGAGGGGAWFWLHQQHPAEAKVAEKKPPVFVTLEPFTVNLLQEGGDHYLQVGIVFQVEGDKAVDAMKTYMPVIRNRILLVLSGKHPSELSQVDGKQKLVSELVLVARESLPEGTTPERGIDGALLSSFVIQ